MIADKGRACPSPGHDLLPREPDGVAAHEPALRVRARGRRDRAPADLLERGLQPLRVLGSVRSGSSSTSAASAACWERRRRRRGPASRRASPPPAPPGSRSASWAAPAPPRRAPRGFRPGSRRWRDSASARRRPRGRQAPRRAFSSRRPAATATTPVRARRQAALARLYLLAHVGRRPGAARRLPPRTPPRRPRARRCGRGPSGSPGRRRPAPSRRSPPGAGRRSAASRPSPVTMKLVQ